MAQPIRMLEIIDLLRQARNPIRAQDLAAKLEVSKRTIYRDIVALQSMQVPIDGEAGLGYILRPGFDLPPIRFDENELDAIVVGMSLLSRTNDRGLIAASERVVRKIEAAHPDHWARQACPHSFIVKPFSDVPAGIISVDFLRKAVRQNKVMSVDYCDENDKTTQRTILPLGIIYYNKCVLLAAWCELRQDFRHFRADRFAKCEVLERSFAAQASDLRQRWRFIEDNSVQ